MKLWGPTIQSALDLLEDKRLQDTSHILIHTRTNDLTARRTGVARELHLIALKASRKLPTARVTMSTLLPSRTPYKTRKTTSSQNTKSNKTMKRTLEVSEATCVNRQPPVKPDYTTELHTTSITTGLTQRHSSTPPPNDAAKYPTPAVNQPDPHSTPAAHNSKIPSHRRTTSSQAQQTGVQTKLCCSSFKTNSGAEYIQPNQRHAGTHLLKTPELT
ncbi:hypothetical protein SRHO_G00068920 [Serrasalmus rhombeus]